MVLILTGMARIRDTYDRSIMLVGLPLRRVCRSCRTRVPKRSKNVNGAQ